MFNVMAKRLIVLFIFIFLTACSNSDSSEPVATAIPPTVELDAVATEIPPTNTPNPTATAVLPTATAVATTLPPTETPEPLPTAVPPTLTPFPTAAATAPDPVLIEGILNYQGPTNAGYGGLGLQGLNRDECVVLAYSNMVTQGDLSNDERIYYAVPIAESAYGSTFTSTWIAPGDRLANESSFVISADDQGQNCVAGALAFPVADDIGLHRFEFRIDTQLVFTGYMQKLSAPPQPNPVQASQSQQTQQQTQTQQVQPSQPSAAPITEVITDEVVPEPFGSNISLGFGVDGACNVVEPVKKWSVADMGEKPFITLAATYMSFDVGQRFTWRVYEPNGNEVLSETETINGSDFCFTRNVALPNLFNFGIYQLSITFDDANIYGKIFELTE